jgi:EAL domain-containing protein (putative c-di-GMP-specific phosphodiesterase class I)
LFKFVLDEAIRDWITLSASKLNLRLSINVPASVLRPELPEMVRQVLPKSSSFPGLLLEITEDVIIPDLRRAREIATQLRLYDVLLSIDDYGAAAASLSRLQELPFHELKLDHGFVENCATDNRNRSICEAAVQVGHQFGMSVCAVGVENPSDLKMLREIGFDSAQGFLFGRPMPLGHLMSSLLTAPVSVSRSDPQSLAIQVA